MPCSPEMRKKVDTFVDSILSQLDSIMTDVQASVKADQEETDTQHEPGNLGKKNAS
jgi:hypothetical protein